VAEEEETTRKGKPSEIADEEQSRCKKLSYSSFSRRRQRGEAAGRQLTGKGYLSVIWQ
jgi:hypothetical protein